MLPPEGAAMTSCPSRWASSALSAKLSVAPSKRRSTDKLKTQSNQDTIPSGRFPSLLFPTPGKLAEQVSRRGGVQKACGSCPPERIPVAPSPFRRFLCFAAQTRNHPSQTSASTSVVSISLGVHVQKILKCRSTELVTRQAWTSTASSFISLHFCKFC